MGHQPAARDFNGHVLGNSFLNSVHARYTGTNSNSANGGIKLNSLGKFDLTDPNGTTEYDSIFKGYTCWQSATTNSPAKTKADGTEIKTKAECEAIYGAGAWRADQDGSLAATSVQGTCTTCHDVHNSLFVETQAEAALRKTCENCHVNNATTGATDATAPQVSISAINHPTTAGTPFDTTKYESACVVCHMATQAEANGNQNSMPVHLWRINTSAAYSTFPSPAQAYGGSCSKHTGASQNLQYLPVVYLSDTSSANCTAAAGTWTAVTKDQNAQVADDDGYAKAVWVDLDLACGQCHGGSFGATQTANGAPYLSKATAALYAPLMHSGASVSQTPVGATPVATGCATLTANGALNANAGKVGDTFTLTDSTTAAHTLYINWGDGTPLSSTLTHPYVHSGHYQVVQTVVDSCGYKSQKVYTITVTGGDNGKGNLKITSSGAAFNYTYQVYATGNSAAITNGKLDVGATKTVILDGGSTYTVKLLLPPITAATPGTCSISGQACLKDSDCPLDVATDTHETCSATLGQHACTLGQWMCHSWWSSNL